MASLSLLLFALIAVVGGLIYFHGKLKKATATVIVLAIALVGLYIFTTLSELILSYLGFETGFPSPHTGYYLYQSVIYIFFGMLLLAAFRYLGKGAESKEVSYAFWWIGVVLLISGALDLLIETFTRVPMMELKLLLAVVLFALMILAATKYRKKFFGKEEKK